MTLHAAIEKLLREKSRAMTAGEIAAELNNNRWYSKKDNTKIQPFQIHGRTRNYPNIFERDGPVISLTKTSNNRLKKTKEVKSRIAWSKTKERKDSDENYVIDLCDVVLETKSIRQHKFDFLKGDTNSQGRSVRLPVDAFYQEINLVVEYRERQHSEEVRFFDKPNKITISGMNRGKQRQLYDQRRREVLPKHNIELVEISYFDFNYNEQKRIIRHKKKDIEIIRHKLKKRNES